MAKFDLLNGLPAPGPQQDVVKSSNRFGPYYRAKHSWAKRFPGPNLYCSTFAIPYRYGPVNWTRYRLLRYRWAHILNDSQRLAWDVLAELVPFRNYYGSIAVEDGWNIFMKLNRICFLQSLPLINNPPGAWDALEIPAPDHWTFYPPHDLALYFPDTFSPFDKMGGAVISRQPKLSGSFPMHYYCDALADWGFDGTYWVTSLDLCCPFFNYRPASQCTVGYYIVATLSRQFTDFYWMRLN